MDAQVSVFLLIEEVNSDRAVLSVHRTETDALRERDRRNKERGDRVSDVQYAIEEWELEG